MKFCESCGKKIADNANTCPRCGHVFRTSSPKKRSTAVLLAVFLSFWTWLYTYKEDAWKFWLNLLLTIFTLGFWGIVAWIWAIIDTSVRSKESYAEYGAKKKV